MAPLARPSDAQKHVIQQLLSTDAELHALASTMTKLALKEMVEIMRHGAPAEKAAIAKSLAAVITKPLYEVEPEDANASLRDEFEQMTAEMRAGWGGEDQEPIEVPVVEQSIEIPQDAPAPVPSPPPVPPKRTKGRVT